MSTEELLHALDRSLESLRLSNRLEPYGTPTDIEERGAILALETLRSRVADLEP